MTMIQLQPLHNAIAAVCPIHGVSIGQVENKQSWVISFKTEATAQQRAAAQVVIDGFNAASLEEPPPATTADDFEVVCLNALNGGDPRIDLRRILKAKFISDLAWRLGKPPAQLTTDELMAERNRIAAIYKNI